MPNPNILDIEIADNVMCSYGCSSCAKFAFSNGKFCCESSPNKCPSIRIRNSLSTKKGYDIGIRAPTSFSDQKKKQIAANVSKTKLAQRLLKTWDEHNFSVKRELVIEEQNYSCLSCERNEWMGKPIKLEVDHIDGNKNNNNRSNLRGLCPNCHSFTETWRKKKPQ